MLVLVLGCPTGKQAPAPTAADTAEVASGLGRAEIATGLADVATGLADADASPPLPTDATEGHRTACWTGAPPAADALVADVPLPAAACPPVPSPLFVGEPVPAATLVVELGFAAPPAGAFAPLADGAWRPIDHGVQGGMHVATGIRVTIPGQQAAKVQAHIHATATLNCAPVATTSIPARWLVQAAGAADAYTDVIPSGPPLWLIFPEPGTKSAQYCDRWLRLHVEVRIRGTAQWGQASATVRLYDGVGSARARP